ncbi:porin family protein [Flavihumibacter fluvii]|jgi:outer membrane protein W|uniref:porin family protein n=1 Tax=Flavihumibacter fluvii TaxID=2838157 RepID=UPI001BDF4052|nr:porin family protein [Flavihumibacter fluvii]ULQ52666.1 PorT family protein [Flavihumibacter fluvii]
MKQFIVSAGLLVTILICSIQLKAQDNMSLGPIAGFGHSWISGGDNKYQPSGNVGLTFTYSPIAHLGLGADLLYSIEGGKRQSGANNIITRADYIRVPLKVKYFFGQYGDRLRPKIEIGPSFGFLVGGHQVVETVDKGEQLSRSNTKDIANGFDVGITAGAGLNYRLMQGTWLLADISYYHGLTNIYQNSALDGRNRNIGFNLGVAFGIGKAVK